MRIAREGWPFIGAAWVALAVLVVTRWWLAAGLLLPVTFWVMAFFRDPVRDRTRGADLILAPADGKIVSIVPIDEPSFLHGPATRLAIFMNVFDVHVNRYPADGTIGLRHYAAGRFLNAAADKASAVNEQSTIGLITGHGKILIRQIAGLIARRIITDHGEGHRANQGGRLGLIRFGSRVDLFLPANVEIVVKTGQHSKAGETVVARWTS